MEDLQVDNLLLESECGKDDLLGREEYQDSSEVPEFFWISKENEANSVCRMMKYKWQNNFKEGGMARNLDVDVSEADSRESKWQDLPMELLVRILCLVDHRMVIVASGVCTGWRDSIRMGVFEISFSWCKRNTSKLVQSLAPKFTRLQVCNLNQRNNRDFLNDFALEALSCHCHDLRALDLSRGTRLTDSSLFALAYGCRRLERLNLSGCTKVTESGLTVLVENCRNLTYLNLCGCVNAGTDKSLLASARNCVRLQSLNLGWCDRISDKGVIGLALWCSDLREVDLCACFLITDRSVIALADKCHHLRVLGLYSCKNITDTAMYALANSSQYRHMKGNLKDNRILDNSDSESALTRSSTGSCSSSTNSSSSSCSNNEGYSVSSSNNEGYSVKSRHCLDYQDCYGLISLNLGMCTNLSVPAVQAVCDAFPGLHTCAEKHSLNISGCLSLTYVHCLCVVEALRERRNRAMFRSQHFN